MSKAEIQKLASKTAQESISLKKEASQLEAKIAKICAKERQLKAVVNNLDEAQRAEFLSELKYQNRQGLAKLKRDDIYNDRVCGILAVLLAQKQSQLSLTIKDKKECHNVLIWIAKQ